MDDLLNEETGRDREDENEKAAGGVTFIDEVFMCLDGSN